MNTLATEVDYPNITDVSTTEDELSVVLSDGRSVSVPLAWYPRLSNSTQAERDVWEISGLGFGIHWPKIDEDISVKNILLGQPSAESQRSFQKWLDSRT